MAQTSAVSQQVEFVTFHVGQALCGLDILNVQEINKLLKWTTVPQSGKYVLGILSLRGEIVTVIDLGKILNQTQTPIDQTSRLIVVNSIDENVALLVDRVGDVVSCSPRQVSPPPANVNGIQAKFITGVHDTGHSIISILNIEEILNEGDL